MEKKPTMWKKFDKVIQSEKFKIKESWHYNFLVLINHYHLMKHTSLISQHSISSFLSPDDGLLKSKRNNIDLLSY